MPPPINASRYIVRDVRSLSVPGQNEKDIWVDPKTGREYIAKKAGRNGRMETLTEYLLNQIGLKLGLRIAEPRLANRDGELRFVGKKFHSRDELLVHGHEFLAEFYSLEEIRAVGKHSPEERKLYSIKNVISGFEAAYLEQADRFIRPFVKMLFFDALVGCQDRHMKNWGIIRSIKGDHPDHFAPLFDTARGLFLGIFVGASAGIQRTGSCEICSAFQAANWWLLRRTCYPFRARSPNLGAVSGVSVYSSKHGFAGSAKGRLPGCRGPRRCRFSEGPTNPDKRCLNVRFAILRQVAASNADRREEAN